MPQEPMVASDLLREARNAELQLIEAEARAEEALVVAEARYRHALEKLGRAQERADVRRWEFEQARARLDQCQLERAAGPLLRRRSVPRPALPRPARDDSRARAAKGKQNESAPAGADSSDPNSEE